MSMNALSNRTSRGASVLTVASLVLMSCGRDTVAPDAAESAVSATASVLASATDNRPSLIVLTAPGGAAAGQPFTAQPVIELRNKGGNLVMANKSVTVSLEGSTVALGGTTSVALVKGKAAFTNLSIPAAGEYALLFTGDEFAPARATITVAPRTVPLGVSVIGTGKVTSDPAGIDCGETCNFDFDANSTVTLTATSFDIGSRFAGWAGDSCTVIDIDVCQVTLDAAKSVTATFTEVLQESPVLTVQFGGSGSGVITKEFDPEETPMGEVLCTSPVECTPPVIKNTNAVIVAVPTEGSIFEGWGGACAGYGTGTTCEVLMDVSKTVIASFSPPHALQFARASTSHLTGVTVRMRTTLGGGAQ